MNEYGIQYYGRILQDGMVKSRWTENLVGSSTAGLLPLLLLESGELDRESRSHPLAADALSDIV